MSDLEQTVQAILERNARVEHDKAWELSLTRRISIAIIIFATAVLFLWSIGSSQFLLQSLVPVAGYLLSTISLPWVRSRWKRLRSDEK